MSSLQNKRDDFEEMLRFVVNSIRHLAIVFSVLAAVAYTSAAHPGVVGSQLTTSGKLFLYFNGFSLFSSACGLMLCACSSFAPSLPAYLSSAPATSKQLKHCAKALPKLMYLNLFLTISLTSALAAYVCKGFATVNAKLSEQLPLIVTCTLGGFVYIQAWWVSATEALDFWKDCFVENQKLWEATKSQTLFGKVFTSYLERFYLPGPASRHEGRNTT